MSQFSNMVLYDAQATPVAHTFTPQSNIAGLTRWRDSDSSVVSSLRPSATMSIREGSVRVSRKVTVKFAVPFQPSIVDGLTPAVKTTEMILTTLVPLDAPAQTIDDIIKYLYKIMYDAQFNDAAHNGNTPY